MFATRGETLVGGGGVDVGTPTQPDGGEREQEPGTCL